MNTLLKLVFFRTSPLSKSINIIIKDNNLFNKYFFNLISFLLMFTFFSSFHRLIVLIIIHISCSQHILFGHKTCLNLLKIEEKVFYFRYILNEVIICVENLRLK
jgi:hypothetical protein